MRHRFADLSEYKPYDYTKEGAKKVEMEATERYELAGDRLVVTATSTGKDETGAAIELRFEATLTRGIPTGREGRCKVPARR